MLTLAALTFTSTFMKKLFVINCCAAVLLFGACQQSSKKEKTKQRTAEAPKEWAMQTDTAKAYNAYLKVKDNLVKSDGKATKEAASVLSVALNRIKGCGATSDLAGRIAATDDVKSQRILFLQVSHDFIPLVKGMKNKPAPVYVAYCPMADEGKGGYWLSAQKEIRNPYYGDEMLECGEVKEEIK
jgi:hypothetical protein